MTLTVDTRPTRALRTRAVRRSWALRAFAAREHPEWRRRAACHGQSELFHGGNNDRLNQARRICETCPVRMDCLAANFRTETQVDPRYWQGVFGGLSANERRDAYYAERKATA